MSTKIGPPFGSGQNMPGRGESSKEGGSGRPLSPASQAVETLKSIRKELGSMKKPSADVVTRLLSLTEEGVQAQREYSQKEKNLSSQMNAFTKTMEFVQTTLTTVVSSLAAQDKSMNEMRNQLENVSDSVGDIQQAQTEADVRISFVHHETTKIRQDVSKLEDEQEEVKELTELNTAALLDSDRARYALTIRKIIEWGRVTIALAFIDYEMWSLGGDDEEENPAEHANRPVRSSGSGKINRPEEGTTDESTKYFIGMVKEDKQKILTSTNLWSAFVDKLQKFCWDQESTLSTDNIPTGSLSGETQSQYTSMPPPPASARSGEKKKPDWTPVKVLLPRTVGILRETLASKNKRAEELFEPIKGPLRFPLRSIRQAQKIILEYEESIAILGKSSASSNVQLQETKSVVEKYLKCEEEVRRLTNAISLICNKEVIELLGDKTPLYDYLTEWAHDRFIPDEEVMEAVDFIDKDEGFGKQFKKATSQVRFIARHMIEGKDFSPSGPPSGDLPQETPGPEEKGKKRGGVAQSSYSSPKPMSLWNEPGPSAPTQSASVTPSPTAGKRGRQASQATDVPQKKTKLELVEDTTGQGKDEGEKPVKKKTRRGLGKGKKGANKGQG